MKARKLSRIIQIWASGEINDGFGGSTNTEGLLAETFCHLGEIGARGAKRFRDLGLSDLENSIVVTTRMRTDFNLKAPNLFLKYKGTRYTIQSISDPDISKSFVQILARKSTSNDEFIDVGGAGGFPFVFA